tara:strand:+ start:1185 stop:1427 length:243 start_codon:yes stop_codon:yes gene_type:complete
MTYYTGAGTKDLNTHNNLRKEQTALLVVDAGTGSVSLQVKAGAVWIVQEAFTADAVKRVFVGGGEWQAIIAGDAAFEWVA